MIFQKPLFKVWGLISLVLVLINLASLFWNAWTTFFLILNLGNILCFGVAFVARNKLNNGVDLAIAFSKKFDAKVSGYQFDTEQLGARNAGIFFIALLLTIGIYVCYVAVTDVQRYYGFIHEDGVIESASALSWFVTVMVLLTSIFRYLKQGHRFGITLILYCGLALFAFLCGGEEISWGQRILEFESPDVFKQINVQSETNLHNIGSISIFSNAFFLITIVFFLLIPYLISKYFGQKRYLKYFLPISSPQTVLVFAITLAVWLFIGIRFGTLGFHPFSFYQENYYNQMDDEMFEFMAAYSFLCFSVTDRLKGLKT